MEGTSLPPLANDWDGRPIPTENRWVVVAPECDACVARAFSWSAASQVGRAGEPVIVLVRDSRDKAEARYGPNPHRKVYPVSAPGSWPYPYSNIVGRVVDGRLTSPRALGEEAR